MIIKYKQETKSVWQSFIWVDAENVHQKINISENVPTILIPPVRFYLKNIIDQFTNSM